MRFTHRFYVNQNSKKRSAIRFMYVNDGEVAVRFGLICFRIVLTFRSLRINNGHSYHRFGHQFLNDKSNDSQSRQIDFK